ncbi:hypothetical protein TWF569_002988 [Orbilia oligospora]|uniref:Uncharacterized protein n=1 Tax=Orbilia oligospora TaxID=2813651 RepID=A0A7C8JCT3_ORBOL|nr:hypothetical protein TWF102_007082 [Orbilia oligospora]KAF3114352.1 hypothetical protein TWF706_008285 [Orbilia oligospora]KAF3117239.1 hypothetical protein TWF103_007386 [Orbilia oligospora]KAF3150040.1 hypothetical protein TWF594_009944 [Orbilia oligospora]KAF3152688.1 hypothetical protein TWF569_002988 [Orbilia oligospora]
MHVSSLIFALAASTSVLALPGPAVTPKPELIEDPKVHESLKSLKELEKLPFDTVSFSELPDKDFKQSEIYRNIPLARKQKDGSIAPAPKLVARTPGGIYITTAINWGGEKGYKVQPFNTCIQLDSPWLYTISSFGPDYGTKCIFYARRDCSNANGESVIWYPGNPDLRNHYHSNWNDRIGSWRCWLEWATGPPVTRPYPSAGLYSTISP